MEIRATCTESINLQAMKGWFMAVLTSQIHSPNDRYLLDLSSFKIASGEEGPTHESLHHPVITQAVLCEVQKCLQAGDPVHSIPPR